MLRLTDEQQQAIEARGGALLVSASAGSGKTFVLTERVVGIVTDETHPVDIDRLLIVTFTRAAAAEMRSRIAERLSDLSAQYPLDERIARQQLLLDGASISTIHAFCISLIQGCYSQLGLPADMRVAQEREMQVLRADVMDDILSAAYAENTPEFISLVELLTASGREDSLAGVISNLFDFARNRPFYREYIGEMAQAYSAEIPFEQTPWCRVLLDYAAQALEYCARLSSMSLELSLSDAALEKAYHAALSDDLLQMNNCIESVARADWDAAAQLISTVSFSSLSSCRVAIPEKALIQKYRSAVKDTIKKLKNDVFIMNTAEHAQTMSRVAPAARELFSLVARYDEALTAQKIERSVMDFGDLEHYTLALLYAPDAGHAPTELCEQLSARYDHLLIDEYQDVSAIQELLFAALGTGKAELFMVGDVKQSIYRFREARPDIFLAKKRGYKQYDKAAPQFPAKISLGANFRTRSEITGFVNSLFSAVMSEELGGMRYTAEDALIANADYDYSRSVPVELSVVSLPKTPEQPEPEAAYVAREIRRLLESGYPVKDGGGVRPVRPGDICILLRSAHVRAESYLSALEEQGVSCWLERQSSVLDARETACVISYLKLLANPMLDMELAAVLMSPMYSLSSEELARLRLSGGKGRLFMALPSAADTVPACARFIEDYRRLRFLSASAEAGELVRGICSVTGLAEKARAISREAEGNLHLLEEYAAGYESRAGGGFSGFVDYIYALERRGYELPAAVKPQHDAVAVMSVHRSKGLEYPVVFLAGCATKFNKSDSYAVTALSPELGFGCVAQDTARMRRSKTLPYIAINIDNARSSLSEELCILYVAMTRAKEKLYLTAYDPALSIISAAADVPFKDGHMDVMSSRRARSFYDWIAPVAVNRPDFNTDMLERGTASVPCEGALKVNIIGEAQENTAADAPCAAQERQAAPADEAALLAMQKVLDYEYPYAKDIVTPAKVAVSDLAERAQRDANIYTRRPKFVTARQLTPAERGVAAHKFMQFADFAAAAADAEAELSRLLDGGYLEQREADCIDLDMIRGFFASSTGRRILSADKVWREIRFIRECTPQELREVDATLRVDAATVVQGVADCVIAEGGRCAVIDYKTDALKTPEEFVSRYAAQLKLYRFILRDTLELPVEDMLIYSFFLGKEISL